MANKLSCREGVYAGWRTAADYLPKAGIQFMEIEVRGLAELKTVADGCRARGVTPLTLSGGIDCMKPESVQAVRAGCDAARAIGVAHYFLSAHGDDRAASMRVLAELGAYAMARGATLCLETHPPFCLNATEMRKTMADIQHPGVRINFDTANIMYYNQGCDSVKELTAIVDSVASVHLKDTDGGFHSGNFPVFGEGVVDFKNIFKTLHAAGFDGPLTMELEGPLVSGLDPDGRHQKVVACMQYLERIGEAFPRGALSP